MAFFYTPSSIAKVRGILVIEDICKCLNPLTIGRTPMPSIRDFKRDQTLKKLIPRQRVSLTSSELTIELLEEASVIMAKIINHHGDIYLPIFIKIMDEIEKQKEQQSYKEKAQRLLLRND